MGGLILTTFPGQTQLNSIVINGQSVAYNFCLDTQAVHLFL